MSSASGFTVPTKYYTKETQAQFAAIAETMHDVLIEDDIDLSDYVPIGTVNGFMNKLQENLNSIANKIKPDTKFHFVIKDNEVKFKICEPVDTSAGAAEYDKVLEALAPLIKKDGCELEFPDFIEVCTLNHYIDDLSGQLKKFINTLDDTQVKFFFTISDKTLKITKAVSSAKEIEYIKDQVRHYGVNRDSIFRGNYNTKIKIHTVLNRASIKSETFKTSGCITLANDFGLHFKYHADRHEIFLRLNRDSRDDSDYEPEREKVVTYSSTAKPTIIEERHIIKKYSTVVSPPPVPKKYTMKHVSGGAGASAGYSAGASAGYSSGSGSRAAKHKSISVDDEIEQIKRLLSDIDLDTYFNDKTRVEFYETKTDIKMSHFKNYLNSFANDLGLWIQYDMHSKKCTVAPYRRPSY